MWNLIFIFGKGGVCVKFIHYIIFSTIEKDDHLVTSIKPNSKMLTPKISIFHENVNIESMLFPKPRTKRNAKNHVIT